MRCEIGALSFILWLGATGALAQPAEPRRWGGVRGAEPSTLQSPQGCFLYRDYVVLEKPSKEMGNDVMVKDRRKLAPKATAAQLCADDGQHVLLRRPAQEEDSFAGIYQGFLLIDSGTGSQRSLILHSLADGKKVAEVTAFSDLPVRAHGKSLYWFNYLDVTAKNCKSEFFKDGVPPAQCRKEADALWQCLQQAAAPRLDAAPNPFSHPGAFSDAEPSNVCQLWVLEQSKLDLTTLAVTPTGHVWGRGYFTAVD